MADSEKKCGDLEAKIGQPFEHEAKLQSLAVRQKELEEALDITKNQAANSLEAEATEQAVEVEPEAEPNPFKPPCGLRASKIPK